MCWGHSCKPSGRDLLLAWMRMVCPSWRNACISRSPWHTECVWRALTWVSPWHNAQPCTSQGRRASAKCSHAIELLWELELAGQWLVHAQHKRLKVLCASSLPGWPLGLISQGKTGLQWNKAVWKARGGSAVSLAHRVAVKVLWHCSVPWTPVSLPGKNKRAVHQSPGSTGLPTLSTPVLLSGERVTALDVFILPLAQMGTGHTDPSMRLLGSASADSPLCFP